MRLTLRLENNNLLIVDLNASERTLTVVSPVPNISMDTLSEIADSFHYKIYLPIVGTIITPKELSLPNKEVERDYTHTATSAISTILALANSIISEY